MAIGDFIIRLCDGGFGGIEAVRRRLGRPRVESISTARLRSQLTSHPSPIVLVDVRSPSEQAVSRIPGAITRQAFEANPRPAAGQRVVVYCTVGGRSYLYARSLVAAGVDAVNYRDGILGWCRAGLPLQSPDHQPTMKVHPYWKIFRVPGQYQVHT